MHTNKSSNPSGVRRVLFYSLYTGIRDWGKDMYCVHCLSLVGVNCNNSKLQELSKIIGTLKHGRYN
jgi:hypothetical protein